MKHRQNDNGTIYHYNNYGQIDSLYDESGVMCYEYGNMGEVTKETRIYALPFLSQPLALSTLFEYDSWGRILNITYPDNEIVNYDYDLGGQLFRMYNVQLTMYNYLDSVLYDRFGAKISQKYGNGIKTQYTYNDTTRRLSEIATSNGALINYTYDLVGNVTQVSSICPWLQNQSFTENFSYDSTDQLISANEAQSYQLAVSYGNWGKIQQYELSQTDMLSHTTSSRSLYYTYAPQGNIYSTQTLLAPYRQTGSETARFTYGINGSLRKRETLQPEPHTEYYLHNSQGNLKAYSDDVMSLTYYGYNAANTRTYKLSLYNTNVWINGQQQPLHLQLQQAMFYPNTYLNFDAFGNYTKHYYNGMERVASRLGDNNTTIAIDNMLENRKLLLEEQVRNEIQELISETPQVDMPPMLDILNLQPTGTPNDVFYYHPNHLGSTAFVTDQNQTITQGFLYAPYGEITTEYNINFGNNTIPKYSFNAKELDEETGFYYYEARYYAPPTFTSRDPLFEKYFWMSPYAYCANNPVKYVDPTGMEWDLSSLTDEQKATWERTMTAACDRSKLFKFIYNKLDESSTVYSVKIGKTIDDGYGEQVQGQYNNKDKSITFSDNKSMTNSSTYIEEMVHAVQLNENKGNYGTGEFNYEFEAKFMTHIIKNEGFPGPTSYDGMENYIAQFDEKYNLGDVFTSKSIDNTFLYTYKQAANDYAKYNKLNRVGNGNYQTATTVNPYSLILMINSVRP